MTDTTPAAIDAMVAPLRRIAFWLPALWPDRMANMIQALAAERDAAIRDRDAGAKDYCALMERHDAEFVRAENAETEAAALRDEVARLKKSMQPFDRMAGAMLARNWNRDGVAISFVEKDGPIRLTFADFLAVRAALTSKGGGPTNWRDDPTAIVEDDEPMTGRDYE